MKLAQFKTKGSDKQRLGALVGDAICDLAELARAVKTSGGQAADWLTTVNNTQEVINRGAAGKRDIEGLLSGSGGPGRGQTVGYTEDSVEFLPPVYPGKILAIGRNYI